MGIQEFPVFIYHRTTGSRTVQIRVPVFRVIYGGVNARNQFIHSPVNVIYPAKSPYDTVLFFRVTLSGSKLFIVEASGNLRPFRHVMPIFIGRKQFIHLCKRGIFHLVDEFPIRTGCRVVEQPVQFKGCRVCLVNADIFSHPTGHRLIFVNRHIPVSDDQHPEPGRVRGMFPGRVDAIAESAQVKLCYDIVHAKRGDIIKIKRNQ